MATEAQTHAFPVSLRGHFRGVVYALVWTLLLVESIRAQQVPCLDVLTFSAGVYLNPNIGRFWTTDSEEGDNEDPRSLHRYLYCDGNPVNRKDPAGCSSEIEVSLASTEAVSIDAASATAVAVAKAFAMRRLETAVARWALTTVVQLASVGLTIEGYELLSEHATAQELERVRRETAKRSNPTGSTYAYEKYKCDKFEPDAEAYFRREGKEPRRITYDSFKGKTWGDNICAAPGFGLFGIDRGQNISRNGHHEGTLVDGWVYDNNVPFGVPRRLWENGYEVGPRDKPIGVFITLRQAHDQKYGIIVP